MPYLDGAQCNLFCDIDNVIPYATHSIVVGRADTLAYDHVGLHAGSQINLALQRAAAEADKGWPCRMQVRPPETIQSMSLTRRQLHADP